MTNQPKMKLISDKEIDEYCENNKDCPLITVAGKREPNYMSRDCSRCNIEAQLSACEKVLTLALKQKDEEIDGLRKELEFNKQFSKDVAKQERENTAREILQTLSLHVKVYKYTDGKEYYRMEMGTLKKLKSQYRGGK